MSDPPRSDTTCPEGRERCAVDGVECACEQMQLVPKRSAVFGFDPGQLFINISGHGDQNGAGRFVFDEKDVDWQPHDERDGCYLEVKLPRSEMVAIRDWLTQQLEAVEDEQ